MKQIIVMCALPFTLSSCAHATTEIMMGDGQVDGRKIEAYSFEWMQCAAGEDGWASMGPLRETATIIGDDMMRIRQEARQPNGVNIETTTYLERSSFSPLLIEQAVTDPEGAHLVAASHVIKADGYESRTMRNGEENQKTGTINRSMFNAVMLGLPLSTLDYADAPFEMTAFMLQFDATYSLTVSLAGVENISFEDRDVELKLVDVKWVHNEIGDIYPPGPDASGGRYWIAQDPPPGLPYVVRYKTDSYAVEFLQDVCGASSAVQ